MLIRKFVLITVLIFLSDRSVRAANFVWTNLAGGNWSNVTNWSPNQVPGANDGAFITNAGTYTVTVNVAASVTNLTIGGISGTQTLANSSFTFTLNGPGFSGTNAVFGLDSSAVFAGAGDLLVAGKLNWSGGTMQGTGRTTVTNGATLNVNGVAHRYLHRNLDLRGNGSYTYNGYYLYGGQGAVFTIFGGATFDLLGDGQMAWSGSGALATLSVGGNFRKMSGAGAAVVNYVVNNGSFVQANSGVLSLIGGGTHTAVFNAESNAVVNFGGGTHTLTNGVGFSSGNGGYHQCDNGTVNVAVPLGMVPRFDLVGSGVLAGNADVNFQSILNWAGGTMQGAGRTVVTNGATLNVNGVAHRFLHRNLDLRGNGSYTYNGYYLYGGAGSGVHDLWRCHLRSSG